MYDIHAVRRLFPHTRKFVYFNVASTGPLADPAYSLQDEYYRRVQMTDVGDQSKVFNALNNIRRNGARIFGCKKSETGFGFNTTFGINLAASGLPLRAGDEVLLTDVEFPANVYPWLELRHRDLTVKFIQCPDGFLDLNRLEKAISRRTRVVSISLVQYFNGFKPDMNAVADLCRRHNIYLVLDAIQGAGCETMNMKKWNVAIASAGGQKWLLSSQGSGIFYVSEELQADLLPPWRSWLSIDWKCRWHDLRQYEREYESSARQYEMGTYPSALVMSLDWALGFLTDLGIRNIQRHNHSLLDLLISYLRSEPAFRITSSLDKKHRSSILSFTSDSLNIKKVFEYLSGNAIITALREGSIRVSAHLYNDENDMKQLIAGLDEAVRRARRK